MMGVLPEHRPFLMPDLLSQLTRGYGREQREIEGAQAAAIADARNAELDRRAKTQQTALGNVPDIASFLGGGFASSLAAGGLPPEGALSGTNAEFAARSAELGQAGLLASNIKDLGAGASSLVDAGAQLPGEEVLAAIAGRNPQNIREIPTGNQTRLASSIALGYKFNDNLFEVYDTRTGESIPGTGLSESKESALADAYGRGVEKQYLGTRLVRAASNAPIATEPKIIPNPAADGTATPKTDPDIVIDPGEPDPTNTAEDPPIKAGTAEAEARARVGSTGNIVTPVPSSTTINPDGSSTITITRPEGNFTIRKNLDGSGTITVPDGRTVPFTAEQAASMGL